MNLSDARTQVEYIIQKQSATLDSDTDTLNLSVWNAMDRYCQDNPPVHVELREGDGTSRYNMRSPFDIEYSVLLKVEFEINQNPPEFRDERYVYLQETESGESDVIIFADFTPQEGECFRLYYTEYSTDISTLRAEHEYAVLNLAGAYALRMMANKKVQGEDDNYRADFVDKRSGLRDMRDLADDLELKYRDRMIGSPDMQQPAVSLTNHDTFFHRKHGRILHKRVDT